MSKQFLRLSAYLFLVLSISTATLTSCSNDDSSVYNIAIKRADVHALTSLEVTIDPEINLPTAIYTWYSPALGGVISNEEVLKYSFDQPGTYELSLKVEEKNSGIFDIYTYNVIVEKNVDYNYVTLDLSDFDLSDGIPTTGGKIWKDTYTTLTTLKHQIFEFSHSSPTYTRYWDGFTVSNSNDNSDQKGGFVSNQWGGMPKGGVKGEGSPYLVAYWGYYSENNNTDPETFTEEKYRNWVKVGDDEDTYEAKNIAVANAAWPYYGILNGDGFGRKFEKGDYFTLLISGVDKDNKIKPNKVTHYLADFRGDELIMSKEWTKVDLSSLGEVKYLIFQMETTDAASYGPNTAVYFCIDELVVDKIEQ